MNPILRLEGVNKAFGGVIAAENVSLKVMPREVHGLIGPNGAGKSTLMNIISGIYTADSGEIFFDEKNITRESAHKRARMGIGRTFQHPRFMQRSSIRDNLLMGKDLGDQMGYFNSFRGKRGTDFDEEIGKLMELAQFTFKWDEEINSLPFGKRKLLEIVRAMLAHPKVILIDEPAAGLNPKEMEHAMALMNYASKQQNIGILLIEHSMDMIMDICEKIVVINFGKEIMTGTPEEVATNQDVIEAYLGRELND